MPLWTGGFTTLYKTRRGFSLWRLGRQKRKGRSRRGFGLPSTAARRRCGRPGHQTSPGRFGLSAPCVCSGQGEFRPKPQLHGPLRARARDIASTSSTQNHQQPFQSTAIQRTRAYTAQYIKDDQPQARVKRTLQLPLLLWCPCAGQARQSQLRLPQRGGKGRAVRYKRSPAHARRPAVEHHLGPGAGYHGRARSRGLGSAKQREVRG